MSNVYLGHINNLYNTTFWAMVLQGGMKNTDAELELKVCFALGSTIYEMLTEAGDDIVW